MGRDQIDELLRTFQSRDCQINALKQVNADLEAALKLVQSHAKWAMDRLPAKYNEGYRNGLKDAGFEYAKWNQAMDKLKQERADDNAVFTKEVMEAEARAEALEQDNRNLRKICFPHLVTITEASNEIRHGGSGAHYIRCGDGSGQAATDSNLHRQATGFENVGRLPCGGDGKSE